MDTETIRHALEFYTGKFPIDAVRSAIEQREAITPVLLAALQKVAEDPEEMEREPNLMLPTYAMYLLAQFREQAAYPLLVKFFSTPGDLCLNTTGELVTEDLGRILACVCHNDLEPIKRMIEDPAVNEYVRSACLQTLKILVLEEKLSREQVVGYFRNLLQGKLERQRDFIWSALVAACCNLYPEELLHEIERAYDDGLVDSLHIRLESVRDQLALGQKEVLRRSKKHGRGFIEDTVAEMHWWACFKEGDETPTSAYPMTAKQPLVKGKKISRNDPCPCGSGKKYKKCCLH
ncbi:MAG: DUF1186 domain-containing protein [Gammaproteobacteria bacterium]